MAHGMRWVGLELLRRASWERPGWAIEGEVAACALVMGMDQHRAQISAEWIDTITGEISRARVAPADRAEVRKFLGTVQREVPWRWRWKQRRAGGS